MDKFVLVSQKKFSKTFLKQWFQYLNYIRILKIGRLYLFILIKILLQEINIVFFIELGKNVTDLECVFLTKKYMKKAKTSNGPKRLP